MQALFLQCLYSMMFSLYSAGGYEYTRYPQDYTRPDAYSAYPPYAAAYGDRTSAAYAYGGYGRGYDMQAAYSGEDHAVWGLLTGWERC